jgi:hypothetical protein
MGDRDMSAVDRLQSEGIDVNTKTITPHEQRKADAVVKAERLVRTASERLEDALKEYDIEVERHEERGDGFFSHAYLAARKEAVLARKHFESRTSALNTARAEQAAPTLPVDS